MMNEWNKFCKAEWGRRFITPGHIQVFLPALLIASSLFFVPMYGVLSMPSYARIAFLLFGFSLAFFSIVLSIALRGMYMRSIDRAFKKKFLAKHPEYTGKEEWMIVRRPTMPWS